MEVKSLTYKEFDALLTKLGFMRQRVDPKWFRYAHAKSNTIILVAEKAPSDLVRITDVVSAWRHLSEKGLASDTDLDRLVKVDVQRHSVARS